MSPIRPENRGRYPTDWPDISARIRTVRARNRCECDGRCGWRSCPARFTDRCTARNGKPHPVTNSTVVLTVAHLDHTPENCDPTNLLAMCQGCHLAYDADHRKETQERLAREAAAAAGQTVMFEGL